MAYSQELKNVLANPKALPAFKDDAAELGYARSLLKEYRALSHIVDGLSLAGNKKEIAKRKGGCEGIQATAEKAEAAQAKGAHMDSDAIDGLKDILKASGTFTDQGILELAEGLAGQKAITQSLYDSAMDVALEELVTLTEAVAIQGNLMKWPPRFALHLNMLNLDGKASYAGIEAILTDKCFDLIVDTARALGQVIDEVDKNPALRKFHVQVVDALETGSSTPAGMPAGYDIYAAAPKRQAPAPQAKKI